MIVAQCGFFYSRNLVKSKLPKGVPQFVPPPPLKVVNDGLGGSPKGRRLHRKTVRPILPSSSPTIGLVVMSF